MTSAHVARSVVVTAYLAAWTVPSSAENLHSKYGPNWDCGYITAGLPYAEACAACEAQGMEFDQIGNGGECVPKAGLNDRRSLRETLRNRLKTEKAEPVIDREPNAGGSHADKDVSKPTGDGPGRSGISSRHGGTIKSESAKSSNAKILEAVSAGVLLMKRGDWEGASDKLDEVVAAARKRDLDQTAAHAKWLSLIALRELRLKYSSDVVRKYKASKAPTTDELREWFFAALFQSSSTGFDSIGEPDRATFAGNDAALSDIFDEALRRGAEIQRQLDANLRSLNFAYEGTTTTREEALVSCRANGGVVIADIVKGFEERPRKFCAVKRIRQEEVTELITDYEKAMK